MGQLVTTAHGPVHLVHACPVLPAPSPAAHLSQASLWQRGDPEARIHAEKGKEKIRNI